MASGSRARQILYSLCSWVGLAGDQVTGRSSDGKLWRQENVKVKLEWGRVQGTDTKEGVRDNSDGAEKGPPIQCPSPLVSHLNWFLLFLYHPDMPVAAPFTQTPLQQQIELECTLQWPHIRSHHMRPSRVQTHFEFEGVEHCVVDLHLSDDAHVPSTAEEHT